MTKRYLRLIQPDIRPLDVIPVVRVRQAFENRRLAATLCTGLSIIVLSAQPASSAEATSQNATQGSPQTFSVKEFHISGNTLLPQATIDNILTGHKGDAVDIPSLRKALLELKAAYGKLGYDRVSITLPRQLLAGGVVAINISEGSSPAQSSHVVGPDIPSLSALPAASDGGEVNHLPISNYLVEGNTALSQSQIESILKPHTGSKMNLNRLREALTELREAYRAIGFQSAEATIPSQILVDGTVRVVVIEGEPTGKQSSTATVASLTPPPPAPTPTFEVRSYSVEGNTLLPQEKIDETFKPFTGPKTDLSRIREGLGELQLTYRRLGFATVGVSLPRQQLTNGIVQVKVTEGVLSKIAVTGNKHFSEQNVLRALPSLKTNVVLNTKWFQPELDKANANSDRQIYPVIGPGEDPGTTALTLKVKDRLPVHGRVEINNKSTPDTPDLHIDLAAQYGNLWQKDHQLGVQYNFTPQEFKRDDKLPGRFFDQPLISSYSTYYRLPIGSTASLRETYSDQPVDFGYDQVSRTFKLPPPTGNPELILYGSRSASETRVRYGAVNLVSESLVTRISSQDADRTATETANVGTKLTLPVRDVVGIRSSLAFGIDFKHYHAQNLHTNLTYVDPFSIQTDGTRIPGERLTLPLEANTANEIFYFPLSLGWSGARPDSHGTTTFNFNQNIFLAGLGSSRRKMQAVALNQDAGGTFTTLSLGFAREEKLRGDWSLLVKGNGQWSSAPLISNEQFGIGGSAGVRGYVEGEENGDAGWRILMEPRAPSLSFSLPSVADPAKATLRLSGFVDYGERYRLMAPASVKGTVRMLGTGLSAYAPVGEHLDARVTVAWPLLDTPTSQASGTPIGYFTLGAQF